MIAIDKPFSKVFSKRPIFRGSDYRIELELIEVDEDTEEETPINLDGYDVVFLLGRYGQDAQISKPLVVEGGRITLELTTEDLKAIPNPRCGLDMYCAEIHVHGNDGHIVLVRDDVAVHRCFEE